MQPQMIGGMQMGMSMGGMGQLGKNSFYFATNDIMITQIYNF